MKTGRIRTDTIRRLFSLTKPHLTPFIIALVSLALGSGVTLILPQIIRSALNDSSVQLTLLHPKVLALELVALFAFQAVCFYFRIYYFSIVGQRVVHKLRSNLFSAIVFQDISKFDAQRSGDLVARLLSDTALMQDAVSVKFSVIIRYSLQVIVGVALMAYISVKLTFAIILALPLLVALSMVLGKKLKRYSKKQQAELGIASVIAEETFGGIRIIKGYNKEGFIKNLFEKSLTAFYDTGVIRTSISAFFQSFVNFLMNGCLVLVLLYGIYLASSSQIAVGDLTSFLLYGVIVGVSFAFATSSYAELLQALGGAERVFEFLDTTQVDKPINNIGNKILAPNKASISFSHVSFSYPSRPDTEVLKDLSFEIPHGSRTALVGSSGSGKTTITNLLLNFYSNYSGVISVAGTNIQDVSAESLRNFISFVPQDPTLFGLSIRENLLLGKETATDAELAHACQQANILDFIRELPSGFDTLIGDKGMLLSGGQKQRLAIARVILKDPKILILDEATSALDGENEALIQEALTNLMKDRTTLIIAHRLSTIKSADKILVLDQGKIVQEGSPSELSKATGIFQELFSH